MLMAQRLDFWIVAIDFAGLSTNLQELKQFLSEQKP